MAFQDLLNEQCVLMDVMAATKEDVLKQIYTCLHEHGKVKPSFYDAVIERENTYPTGLELGGMNVAIPHVVPEHVLDSALAVAVMKNPVPFGRMDEPDKSLDVKVVFSIALAQEGKQLETLQTLMKLFESKETMDAVVKAKSPAEIIDILRKEAK